jgi:hypothetical protein
MTGRSSRCPARRRLPGGRKPLLHPRDRPVVSERAVGLCPHRSYRRRAVTLARRRDAASRLQREAPRVPVSVSHGCTRHADCTPSTFATLAARSPHHPCRLKGAKGGTVWWSTIVLVSSPRLPNLPQGVAGASFPLSKAELPSCRCVVVGEDDPKADDLCLCGALNRSSYWLELLCPAAMSSQALRARSGECSTRVMAPSSLMMIAIWMAAAGYLNLASTRKGSTVANDVAMARRCRVE